MGRANEDAPHLFPPESLDMAAIRHLEALRARLGTRLSVE